MWVIPKLTPLFRERMNDILGVYTEPLPKGHEVHCFDETPKQMLSTPCGQQSMKPGHPCRIDYEYKRHGKMNVFVAVAPFEGTRTVSITKRRTAKDTADFLWKYCMEEHKEALHIELVLDNLNTHKEKSLGKIWSKEQMQHFCDRVTFHFTPCHASWLNMAELEIHCLKTQGLKRRIASEKEMIRIVDGIVQERNARQAMISWNFTKEKARDKFQTYIPRINLEWY